MSYCYHEGDFTLEKKMSKSGTWNVFRVCSSCSRKYGSMVSIKTLETPLDKIPIFDEERDARIWKKQQEEQMERYSKYKAEKELEIGSRVRVQKDQFFQWYNEYLQSEEWMEKRALVLNRDKNICQACLAKSATQIHHTTYKHVGFEPLFELVSVCGECHEKITKMDRGVFE